MEVSKKETAMAEEISEQLQEKERTVRVIGLDGGTDVGKRGIE